MITFIIADCEDCVACREERRVGYCVFHISNITQMYTKVKYIFYLTYLTY